MRLICPNCGAQYNIADDAIPDGGRDVQCSSCGHTWLQTDVPVVTESVDESTATGDVQDNDSSAEPEIDELAETAREAVPASAMEPERKNLDAAVADILRTEASRGDSPTPAVSTASAVSAVLATSAATAEGEEPSPITTPPIAEKYVPPATQNDVQAEVVDADETRKRIAQMTVDEGGTRAGSAQSAAAAAAAANLRRVPDINEINAALRARAQASDTSGLTEAEKQEAVQRSGFRRGFFFVLILFAILITPYFFADQITENLPQTRNFMASYMLTVDGIRVWLNAQIGSITR